MNEVIQNLKVNVKNSRGNYCCISERKLEAIKELAKREEQELSKYTELYVKALDNTIKSDRELMKYKEASKRAIEYINNATITENSNTYIKNLLEILEVNNE